MTDIDRRPYKVKLPEDKRWVELFDRDEEIQRWSSVLGADYVYQLREGQSLQRILGDLFDAKGPGGGQIHPKDWFPGKKGPRKASYNWDDVTHIMDTYRDHRGRNYFPKLHDLRARAFELAVEEAVLPGWQDLEWAFEQAKDHVFVDYRIDRGMWDQISWTEDEILESLLKKVKMDKAYTITADFSRSSAVRRLEKAYTADPENLSEKEMEEGLGEEFHNILSDIVDWFFRQAQKDSGQFDVSNRLDFKKFWYLFLEDKDDVAPVREELVEFLREHPAPAEER